MTNNKIYNWKKYNLNKSKLIQKIILYNQKNNFNFLEKNHFNHTRDIIALSIATIKKKKFKTFSLNLIFSNEE